MKEYGRRVDEFGLLGHRTLRAHNSQLRLPDDKAQGGQYGKPF